MGRLFDRDVRVRVYYSNVKRLLDHLRSSGHLC